jgi:hypothetical protein
MGEPASRDIDSRGPRAIDAAIAEFNALRAEIVNCRPVQAPQVGFA